MIRNLRWYMAGLLTLATTLCYLDRQAFTIASVVLKKQFSFTNEDYATMVMAYTLAYGLMHPVMGRFLDWINTRRGLAISVAAWSLASMAHALGSGLVSFSVLRAALGVTEAGSFPGAVKSVSEWFPAKERAMATGIFNCGAGIGAIIAPPLVVWLILRWGWQVAFLATGGVGFLWAMLWLACYHTPEKHPRISKSELDYIRADRDGEPAGDSAPAPAKGGVWREVVTRREFWALGFARFLADPVWGFYLYWLPMYLKDARGFDLVKIGAFAWVPFLSSDFGSLAGGALSSYLIKRGCSTITARKIAMCICAALMPAALVAMRARDPLLAILCISVATFGHQSWSANMITLPTDIFPRRLVACAYGLTAVFATVGGLLSTRAIGWALDNHYGYGPILIAVAFMHPIAALILLGTLRPKRSADQLEVV